MSLFSTANIDVRDPSLPRVSRNDIASLSDAEFGAYGHWLFDKGTSAGLTDIAAAKTLTLGDITPTYGSNYVGLTNGPSDGLLTDLPDTDLDEVTIWAVVRQPAVDGQNGTRFLFGSSTGSAGIGAAVATSTTTPPLTVRLAASGNPYAVSSIAINQWFFVAISLRLVTGSLLVRAKYNDDAVDVYTPLGGVAKSNLPISVGNYHYGNGPNAAVLQFAELGIIRAALASDELDGLKTRSALRMAARGITIGA